MSKTSNLPLMKTLARRFVADREGVTAIEYGLIAGLIAVGIVTTLGLLSGNLQNLFTTVVNSVGGA